MAKKQKNISLDEITEQQLDDLEKYTTLTASALLRQYIREAHKKMRDEIRKERALEAGSE